MSQRAPSFIQRLHLAFGHSSHRWGSPSFSLSSLSANPRAQSRDDLPSFLFFLNRVRAMRRTSRICGEQRERRGGRQINSEQRRGIPACINAFHGCYEHCYRRTLAFAIVFYCLCNCEHHPPIVVYLFPPPRDCTACVHTVYGRGRV